MRDYVVEDMKETAELCVNSRREFLEHISFLISLCGKFLLRLVIFLQNRHNRRVMFVFLDDVLHHEKHPKTFNPNTNRLGLRMNVEHSRHPYGSSNVKGGKETPACGVGISDPCVEHKQSNILTQRSACL